MEIDEIRDFISYHTRDKDIQWKIIQEHVTGYWSLYLKYKDNILKDAITDLEMVSPDYCYKRIRDV